MPRTPRRTVRLACAVMGVLLLAWVGGLTGGEVAGVECLGLRRPVDGPVVREFAPIGAYGGHWGVDLAAPAGTVAVAQADGVVTFSGSVAGNQAVTVDHGGGLRTTVSSLTERLVVAGQAVAVGTPLAVTGVHDDDERVHASARIDGSYVDPVPLWGCVPALPGPGLRLVPIP